jgi:hypothetical protein
MAVFCASQSCEMHAEGLYNYSLILTGNEMKDEGCRCPRLAQAEMNELYCLYLEDRVASSGLQPLRCFRIDRMAQYPCKVIGLAFNGDGVFGCLRTRVQSMDAFYGSIIFGWMTGGDINRMARMRSAIEGLSRRDSVQRQHVARREFFAIL